VELAVLTARVNPGRQIGEQRRVERATGKRAVELRSGLMSARSENEPYVDPGGR